MNDVVSMKIDESLVKDIVGKQVQAAVVAQLGDPAKMIEQAVQCVLNRKVDSNGRHRNDRYYDKYDYLEMLATDCIHKAAEKALKDWLNENADKVAEAVKKEMSKPSRSKMFAIALANSVRESLSTSWNITCNLNLKEKKNDY